MRCCHHYQSIAGVSLLLGGGTMFKRLCLSMFVAVCLCTSVSAQESRDGYGNVHVYLNGGDNVAYIGQTNTIEFWIENDATVHGMSIGFEFDIQVAFQFDPNHGGAGHYVQEHGKAVGAFDMMTGLMEVTGGMNDLNPDSLYFGGSTYPGTGIASGPLELCYTMQFDIPEGRPEVAGGLSIDNAFVLPGGTWTFVDASEDYAPYYQGNPNSSQSNPDAPAVVFDIVSPYAEPPSIVNCPMDGLTISYSDVLNYQFEASDPDPGDVLSWTIVEGPGTIDGTGLYYFDPDTPAEYNVTVEVEDMAANTDQCSFVLYVTNTAPTITNCPGTINLYHCEQFIYHFEATDPDPGETFFWEEISGWGIMNSQTGDFIFDANQYEPGASYMIDIMVRDNLDAEGWCTFDINVINHLPQVSNSDTDTINAVPLTIKEYVIAAFDPDPCDQLIYLIESAREPVGEYWMAGETLYFEPLHDDVGSVYEFTIAVTDDWDTVDCHVWIDVLYGNDCVTPIYIDSLPFSYQATTADYADVLQPDPNVCGAGDEGFGVGPEIIFHYTPLESDTISVMVDPMSNWDPAIYVLASCDVDSCLAGVDDMGDFQYEVMSIPMTANEDYYLVCDGVGNSIGRVNVHISPLGGFKCKSIEAALNNSSPKPDKSGIGRAAATPDISQPNPIVMCDRRWSFKASKFWAKAGQKKALDKVRPGFAEATIHLTGTYEVFATTQDPPVGAYVECSLLEQKLGCKMSALARVDADASRAYFSYDRNIFPFGTKEFTLTDDGWLQGIPGWDMKPLVYNDPPFGADAAKANVSLEDERSFNLTFSAIASRNKGGYAYVWSNLLDIKLTCVTCEDADGKQVSKDVPVTVEISDIVLSPNFRRQTDSVTVPDELGCSFIELDSGQCEVGGLAFSTLPQYGSQLYIAERMNEIAYVDTGEIPDADPWDTSAVLTLDGNSLDTFELSDILSAPSNIIIDTTGHFDNDILVTQVDEFDEYAIPLDGLGSILKIDEYGTIDTLVNQLHSPVALAVSKAGMMGSYLFVSEIGENTLLAIDPAGTSTLLTDELYDPIALAVGTGSFGDFIYVAEYDTTNSGWILTPNSGRISRVNERGEVSVFVDALQAPIDLEFGPGGVFGTDLYVLLDNDYDDSTAFVPNTGRIVTVDATGNVTEFASGLETPTYLAFDPAGLLYVSVAGGILKIGPYTCGDADANGVVNVSDIVWMINFVFGDGPEPSPLQAGDVDCNGSVNVSDIVYLINFVFGTGQDPCDPDNDGVPDC
jgi:hypothetical protein